MKTLYKKIEADHSKNCLIVHYDIIDNQYGHAGVNGFRQIINLSKPANIDVNLQKLAHAIVRKYDIIPKLRLPELVAALIELNRNGSLSSTLSYEFSLVMHNFLSNTTAKLEFNKYGGEQNQMATLSKLDHYIEQLYDELEDKILSALAILQLVRQPENLATLAKNDTLLCALSRVLREDGKKSLDLSIYISCIFSHFSNYFDFHYTISNYKVGSTCFELIYFEIFREESWCKELSQKKQISENEIDNLNAKLSYEKLLVSYQNLVKKQNTFFKFALIVLMNISEDLKLEYKIVNKGIIALLIKMLERNSQELLLVIVIYLKKLSVFIENKNRMKELNILKSVIPLLSMDNELLIFNTLKLLYNLMLDREIRVHFIRGGALSKLVYFFVKDCYNSAIVSILYLISCEAKYLPVLTNYPQLVSALMEKATQNVKYKTVLYSLLANLASNYALARLMIDSTEYAELTKAAFLDTNLHLLRMCRNLSCHQDQLLKLSLVAYQENLIETMLASVEQTTTLVECAAILTNLCSLQINWMALFSKYSLYQFMLQVFASSRNSKKNPETAVRQLLLLLAAIAHQPQMSVHFVENNAVDRLIDLLNDNQENDDIVLYIIYCFYIFIKMARDVRSKICRQNKLIDYLIDLMYDRDYRIKSLCIGTLELISEEESELQDKIKKEKFNAYNHKWLCMIQSDRSSDESSHSILEDMFIYPDLFLKMDLLNDSSSEIYSDDN